MNKHPNWYIKGEYLEACNCDVVCPCLVSAYGLNEAKPTYGHCDLMCAYHVDEGEYEGIDISGLSHIIICYTPREMKWHDWSIAQYYDSKGTEEQQEAMRKIFSGTVGGPAEDLIAAMAVDLGISPADISWERNGKERTVTIPGIFLNYARAKDGMQNEEGTAIFENVHPQCYSIAPGVCVDGRWSDHNMMFNNSGKGALFGDIYWSPESTLAQPVKK